VTLNIGPQVGTGSARWKGVALSALSAAGEPASWINSLLRRMQQESGGNANAINLWDSNAAHGDPSRGLMQTIMATFNAYAGPYRSRGIYDPFANIYAAIKYTVARYGSGPAGWDRKGGYKLGGLTGYETGAWKIPRDQIAKIHKGEMVVPAKPAEYLRRSILGFGGGQQKVRSKLHQLHEAHLAHVAHVDHLNHENDWARLIGRRPRAGSISGDMSGGGLITLHPDTIDAIGAATAGALKSSPLQVAVDLDGRKLDTALSRSALGRGY
jgi:SLT domain-containing protein